MLLGSGIDAMSHGAAVAQQTPVPVDIANTYPNDVMRVLWWLLGILASFAVFVSCGTAIWMLKTVMAHDKDIQSIKERCKILHDEEE